MFKYSQLIITILMIFLILPFNSNIELNFFNSSYPVTPLFLVLPLAILSIFFFFLSSYLNRYVKSAIMFLKGIFLGSLPSLYSKILYIKMNHLDYIDLNFIRINYLYSYEERIQYLTELLNFNGLNSLTYKSFENTVLYHALNSTTASGIRAAADSIINAFNNKIIEVPQKTYWDAISFFFAQDNVIASICLLLGICTVSFYFHYEYELQDRKLNVLNEELKKTNESLEKTNKEVEANKLLSSQNQELTRLNEELKNNAQLQDQGLSYYKEELTKLNSLESKMKDLDSIKGHFVEGAEVPFVGSETFSSFKNEIKADIDLRVTKSELKQQIDDLISQINTKAAVIQHHLEALHSRETLGEAKARRLFNKFKLENEKEFGRTSARVNRLSDAVSVLAESLADLRDND